MASPYDGLPDAAFWRPAVAEADPATDPALYTPRHRIGPDTAVFTAGSCFAQHVTRALARAGCDVIDAEPMPLELPQDVKARFGYGQYAARFGNLYTIRQFRQLVAEALGRFAPALPVWTRGDRFFDALRPGVEPEGLGSAEAVAEARAQHLTAVKDALARADLIVFTLGLTETWDHRATGTVYPTAPETLAGRHDPAVFGFRNLGYQDCLEDFRALQALIAEIRPGMRYLLTVSPVPLTATASGDHVLTATGRSKAILRAVCAQLCETDASVDYFPSYELMTAPRPEGHGFAPNLRSPTPAAVDRIMGAFLAAHGLSLPPETGTQPVAADAADPACEEALLDSFAR